MSTIGTGVAASVSAIGAAERAQVAKKASEKRDEAKARKELEDRYDGVHDVEEAAAVRQTEHDDESPADDRREKRPEVHKPETEPGANQGSKLDIQA